MLQRAQQLVVARVPLHLGVHGVHVVNVRHPPGIGRVARQRIGTGADARCAIGAEGCIVEPTRPEEETDVVGREMDDTGVALAVAVATGGREIDDTAVAVGRCGAYWEYGFIAGCAASRA